MNATSIIPTPGLANADDLHHAHVALETAMSDTTKALSLAKQARSQLCEAPEFLAPPAVRPETSRWDAERINASYVARKTAERDKRRLLFFACYLRVVNCNNVLTAAISNAAKAVTSMRETIDSLGASPSFEKQCAMVNCFTTDDLLMNARLLLRGSTRDWWYYHVGDETNRKYGPETIYLIPGVHANLHEMLQAEYDDSKREWMVLAGGGYGTAAPPTEPPSGPFLTFEEASDEGGDWIGYGCTIGASASCYNIRTGTQRQP